MFNPLAFAKDKFDEAFAKIQGEVGRFLILKERIMRLPADVKAPLLREQSMLESEATGLLSEAQGLKTEFSQPFTIPDSLTKVAPLTQKALDMVAKAGAVVVKVNDHKRRVEAAEQTSGVAPGSPMPEERRVNPWVLIAIGAVGLGVLLGRKAR